VSCRGKAVEFFFLKNRKNYLNIKKIHVILRRKKHINMTLVSSKRFANNQKEIYNLALNERVFIKRGKNIFYLAFAAFDDDEASDLADAIAAENDDNIDVDDYLKSIYERAKCASK